MAGVTVSSTAASQAAGCEHFIEKLLNYGSKWNEKILSRQFTDITSILKLFTQENIKMQYHFFKMDWVCL